MLLVYMNFFVPCVKPPFSLITLAVSQKKNQGSFCTFIDGGKMEKEEREKRRLSVSFLLGQLPPPQFKNAKHLCKDSLF